MKETEDKRAPQSRKEGFFPRYEARIACHRACFSRYDSHKVDDILHRINTARSKIRNEAKALITKAEAQGISLDIPELSLLVEASDTNRTPFTATSPRGTQFIEASRDEAQNMRIIIDADDVDQPLKIEPEPSRRKVL